MNDRAFLRDVQMFRPYTDEVPWELIERDEHELTPQLRAVVAAALADQEGIYLRIAKYRAQAIGLYLLQRQDQIEYRLLFLVVDAGFTGRGLGHWLLGHAIGITESKGGRTVVAHACPIGRFLSAYGFQHTPLGHRFEIGQE